MSKERYEKSDRYDRGGDWGDRGDRGGRGKKPTRVNVWAEGDVVVDYKDTQLLKNFVTERGKIIPRRVAGNTAKQQRQVCRAIKRARILALMPFSVTGK